MAIQSQGPRLVPVKARSKLCVLSKLPPVTENGGLAETVPTNALAQIKPRMAISKNQAEERMLILSKQLNRNRRKERREIKEEKGLGMVVCVGGRMRSKDRTSN